MNDNAIAEEIEASPLFNADWYVTAYPDVQASGLKPAVHYHKYGWKMGRDPSPSFSTLGYLEIHPDVNNKKINPLLHYVLYGNKENRKLQAPTSESKGPVATVNSQVRLNISKNRESDEFSESTNRQLNSTQHLLEFYYNRCQELEYQLLDR